jgi:dihydroorotase-like cyclic amidohydrolase
MATTLIKGGTVVSATGSAPQDVLTDGETIAAVLAPGSNALGPINAHTVIAPGSDADIVVYDPPARQVLSARSHHMIVDYSAYEGMKSPAGWRPCSPAGGSLSTPGTTTVQPGTADSCSASSAST